jgi:hypothetical protein
MTRNRPAIIVTLALMALMLLTERARATRLWFEAGDIFVSLEEGPVQWFHSDGTPFRVLAGTVPGAAEGMAFDANSNLYVTRWCIDPSCTSTGNAVEMFDPYGRSWGAVATGFDCSPHTLIFDSAGTAFVGQAGCRRSLLKFVPGADPVEFFPVEDQQGVFWLDLAADGCTLFYTSYGPNVKRFDGCTGLQLSDFNAAPLPGGVGHDLRVLDDGGVLVSSGEVISRLDASGSLVQTYALPQSSYWAGLDLAGDGTFLAANYFTSDVCRFELDAGTFVGCFTTGAPPNTIVDIVVHRPAPPSL